MASFLALCGWQVVPHAIWWCQAVTGWSPGAARGLPGGYRGQTVGFREKLVKGVFCPLAPRGGFGGSSPHSGAYRTRGVERGFGGILPPLKGQNGLAPSAKRGIWGDPPPILGTKLASPGVKRGVWVGSSPPHSTDKIGHPLVPIGGAQEGGGGAIGPGWPGESAAT